MFFVKRRIMWRFSRCAGALSQSNQLKLRKDPENRSFWLFFVQPTFCCTAA